MFLYCLYTIRNSLSFLPLCLRFATRSKYQGRALEPDESVSSCCVVLRSSSRSGRFPPVLNLFGPITTIYSIWGKFDTMTDTDFERLKESHVSDGTFCAQQNSDLSTYLPFFSCSKTDRALRQNCICRPVLPHMFLFSDYLSGYPADRGIFACSRLKMN